MDRSKAKGTETMKRALFAAAVSALGALGTAGLMAAAPAQAGPAACDALPIGGGKLACLADDQINTFGESINPVNQVGTFLNGTDDPDTGDNDGLGILDQPATFAQSLQDFANGPTNP